MDAVTLWLYEHSTPDGKICWIEKKNFTYMQIGKDLGLSGTGVSNRVKNLLGKEIFWNQKKKRYEVKNFEIDGKILRRASVGLSAECLELLLWIQDKKSFSLGYAVECLRVEQWKIIDMMFVLNKLDFADFRVKKGKEIVFERSSELGKWGRGKEKKG